MIKLFNQNTDLFSKTRKTFIGFPAFHCSQWHQESFRILQAKLKQFIVFKVEVV